MILIGSTLRIAGQSGASLPRSTIIAIAVAVAGGVVLVGIIALLALLWCAAAHIIVYSIMISNLLSTLTMCPVRPQMTACAVDPESVFSPLLNGLEAVTSVECMP